MTKFDVIVVGSGPGGYVAAIRAGQLGMKTAVVEQADLGGICLNWGCIPTKALLKCAHVYQDVLHASDFGVELTGEARPDFGAIVARSRAVSAQMSKGVHFLLKKNGIEVIAGRGRLAGNGRVEVSPAEGASFAVEADHIILATGARPKEVPALPVDGKKIVSYRQALALERQPDSLVVVGSGAIGVELASFYHAIGTRVTLVEFLPRILPLEDEEVSKALERVFRRIRLNVLAGSAVERADTAGDRCRVYVKTPKGEQVLEADTVLSAVGVTPNIEDLGLEETGVKVERGRVVVDEYYRTAVPGVYAVGDIVPGPALAHVASAEAVCCVEAIAGRHSRPLDYGLTPSCVFTSPEIASVGLTERQAAERGHEVRIGKFPFTASGKAAAVGCKDGFVKLVIDAATDKLLGAHLIGPGVTDMIMEPVLAMKLGATARQLAETVHPHPTLSEAIMEAAAAAHGEVIHL